MHRKLLGLCKWMPGILALCVVNGTKFLSEVREDLGKKLPHII